MKLAKKKEWKSSEVSNIEVKKEKGWKVFIGFHSDLKSTVKEVWWGQSQISEVGR